MEGFPPIGRERISYFIPLYPRQHQIPLTQAQTGQRPGDGQLVVQRWLHYESLAADLAALARDWQLPLPTEAAAVAAGLPRFKVIRHQPGQPAPPLESYLSAEAVAAVNARCAWSFAHFGYRQRQPEDWPALTA